MNYRQIALLIPAAYRREILETNVIGNAVAVNSNASMNYLGVIWNEYVAHEDLDCGQCLVRVLKNYQQLLPELIAMEKEAKLLNDL